MHKLITWPNQLVSELDGKKETLQDMELTNEVYRYNDGQLVSQLCSGGFTLFMLIMQSKAGGCSAFMLIMQSKAAGRLCSVCVCVFVRCGVYVNYAAAVFELNDFLFFLSFLV